MGSDPGQERLIHETEEMEARNFILTRNDNTIVFTAAQNIPNPKLKWQGKLVLELPDNYPEVLPNISIELADRHLYNPSEYLKSLYLPVGAPLEQIAYAVITLLSKSIDSQILNKSGKNTKKVLDLDSDSADSATENICAQCQSVIPETDEMQQCRSCQQVYHSTCYDYLISHQKLCPQCKKML